MAFLTATQPQPKPLRCYFVAQVLFNLIEWGAYKRLGQHAPLYSYIYVGCEFFLVVSCLVLVLNVLGTLESRFRLLAIGAILALIGPETVYYNLGRHADMTDWVNIVRGGLVLWLGFMMVGIWSLARHRYECLALGWLWILQALVSLGHPLHIEWQPWQLVDIYAQPLLAIAVWGFIGILLRQKAHRVIYHGSGGLSQP